MIEYDIAILEEVRKELKNHHINSQWGKGMDHNRLSIENGYNTIYVYYDFTTTSIEVVMTGYDMDEVSNYIQHINIKPVNEYDYVPFGRVMWSFELAKENSISSAIDVIEQILKSGKSSLLKKFTKYMSRFFQSIRESCRVNS